MALVKDAVSFHFTQSLFALLEKKQINVGGNSELWNKAW